MSRGGFWLLLVSVTHLSVAFIHNPCDLNLFPPHCPRLFVSLFLQLTLFFRPSVFACFFFKPGFLLSTSSAQFKDSSSYTCERQREKGSKSDEKWQNRSVKKQGKAESEPHGTANKDKRICRRSEAALFSAINIMQIRFSRFGCDYEGRQHCHARSTVTENLTVFWKCH